MSRLVQYVSMCIIYYMLYMLHMKEQGMLDEFMLRNGTTLQL